MADVDVKRGVKRKRDTHGKTDDIPSRLRAKLYHGVKEVKKVGKKVRTFEAQKVVKKLKDARKVGDEEIIKSFEAQLQCLKQHIDHEQIAVQALRSKINKDSILSRNPDCQAAVISELQVSRANTANAQPQRNVVESRLLSSKALALEISTVIQSLQEVLVSERDDIKGAVEEEEIAPVDELPKGRSRTARKENEEANEAEGEPDDFWTGFSDEDNDGVEQDDEEHGGGSETVSRRSQDSDSLDDRSRSGYHSTSSLPPLTMKKARLDLASPGVKATKAEVSTFLPSLSVGFVNGGSDSEWSDAEADIVDAPQKKNRRGQRARKAIWEKKYGRNANHLKKQREEGEDATQTSFNSRGGRGRGSGRGGAARGRGRPDPTRPAHATQRRPPAGRGQGRGLGSGSPHRGYGEHQPQGDRGTYTSLRLRDHGYGERSRTRPNSKDDSRPLHPSWEAKRRLKEKQNAGIVPPQGTRMTFT